MPNNVCFIGCSKSKKRVPCIASEMYQGALFKKSMIFAKRNYEKIFIVSAKYGIIPVDKLINPYEKTLKTANEIREWKEKTLAQSSTLFPKDTHFIFLCAEKYCFADGYKPLHGMRNGKRLQWLNQQISTHSQNKLLL